MESSRLVLILLLPLTLAVSWLRTEILHLDLEVTDELKKPETT